MALIIILSLMSFQAESDDRQGSLVSVRKQIVSPGVDLHIKLNKPSHEQLNNFAGKLTDRPPCGKAAG
jgi:hypothetical protein